MHPAEKFLARPISIEEYIVANNPEKAQLLAIKYNLGKAKTRIELAHKLNHILKKYRQDAIADFTAIETPYKGMLGGEIKSGACGCSAADGSGSGEQKSGCGGDCGCKGKKEETTTTGTETKSAVQTTTDSNETDKTLSKFNKYAPVVGVGMLALIFVAVIAKGK